MQLRGVDAPEWVGLGEVMGGASEGGVYVARRGEFKVAEIGLVTC